MPPGKFAKKFDTQKKVVEIKVRKKEEKHEKFDKPCICTRCHSLVLFTKL